MTTRSIESIATKAEQDFPYTCTPLFSQELESYTYSGHSPSHLRGRRILG